MVTRLNHGCIFYLIVHSVKLHAMSIKSAFNYFACKKFLAIKRLLEIYHPQTLFTREMDA